MNRKDVCKEESKTLGLIELGEERTSDGLQLPNLGGWEMGRPCGRHSREGDDSLVDNLGFQKWRDVLGRGTGGGR